MPSQAKTIGTVPSKVLLVDGHRAGLKARCMVLEEAGYHATGVSHPEEALQLLRQETFQIVVTEYKLTGTNGKEFIGKVRGVAGSIPVLLLSGWVEPLGLNERSTGANAVLMKSASEPKQLALTVRRLLRLSASARAKIAKAKKPAVSVQPEAAAPLLRRAVSGA
jgi:CheY-like chemotaxis protein